MNKKFEYIDIHSHLYFPEYDADRKEEIKKMQKEKIATICIGTNLETSVKAVELSQKHENIFASIGQHPASLSLDSRFEEGFKQIVENNNKVVAVGECGLDYFRLPHKQTAADLIPEDELLKKIQKTIFEYHIDFSIFASKPLMLHIRSSKNSLDAYEDCLQILEHHFKISGSDLRGNVHFFTGDIPILKRFLNMNFTVSFTGVVTWSRELDEAIKYVPSNMMMVETDAPFVAPVPHRGKRNSPLYIKEIVRKISEIKGVELGELKLILRDNAERVFSLKNP